MSDKKLRKVYMEKQFRKMVLAVRWRIFIAISNSEILINDTTCSENLKTLHQVVFLRISL